MDKAERIANAYLQSLGYVTIVHEPDGNIPPDFAIDGRIGVEVTRLSQREERSEGRPRSLEEVSIPLVDTVRALLPNLGRSRDGESWFVIPVVKRPVPRRWRQHLVDDLREFRDGGSRLSGWRSAPFGHVILQRASKAHPDFFVLGGSSDEDAGGFEIAELIRNIPICLEEKGMKIDGYRARYTEWWLLLVDQIGRGSPSNAEPLRTHPWLRHGWDKIVIVSPDEPTRGYEL